MLKIKLSGKKGVDYNAYVDDYFADFTHGRFPDLPGGDRDNTTARRSCFSTNSDQAGKTPRR